MNKKNLFTILGITLIIFIVFLIFLIFLNKSRKNNANINDNTAIITESDVQNDNNKDFTSKETISYADEKNEFPKPIDNALKRVTKKPFGIKVSPNNSPVQPEIFYGYHTSVDFEVFAEEENLEVDVLAICTGRLIVKRWMAGYGGVIVQQCEINDEAVTVIYGHLKLASVSKKLNENIDQGQKIGILGEGFSSETDNERKHLHLGIHRGEVVNFVGYVQNPQELDNWIDYEGLVSE